MRKASHCYIVCILLCSGHICGQDTITGIELGLNVFPPVQSLIKTKFNGFRGEAYVKIVNPKNDFRYKVFYGTDPYMDDFQINFIDYGLYDPDFIGVTNVFIQEKFWGVSGGFASKVPIQGNRYWSLEYGIDLAVTRFIGQSRAYRHFLVTIDSSSTVALGLKATSPSGYFGFGINPFVGVKGYVSEREPRICISLDVGIKDNLLFGGVPYYDKKHLGAIKLMSGFESKWQPLVVDLSVAILFPVHR